MDLFWMSFFAVGVVVFGLTEGLKRVPLGAGKLATVRRVLLPLLPVLLGAALGFIPGVFSGTLGARGMWGGAAGALSGVLFAVVKRWIMITKAPALGVEKGGDLG